MRAESLYKVREQPERVVLEVEDTGIGIPERDLPRIFERFYRVPDALGRTHEGTGIGLSLVRAAELHGGRVSVESEIGRGSRFRVELQKGYAHLPADAPSGQQADGCRERAERNCLRHRSDALERQQRHLAARWTRRT